MSQMYSCVSIWKGWVSLENMIYSSLWYLRVPWLIPAVFELWVMFWDRTTEHPAETHVVSNEIAWPISRKKQCSFTGSMCGVWRVHWSRTFKNTSCVFWLTSFNTFRTFHFYEWRLWQNTPSRLACEEAQKWLEICAIL